MGVDLLAAAVEPRSGWAHDLRVKLQSVSSVENFRQCGQPWAREVKVVMAPTGETRRIGMHLCNSCWLCPICWSRRRIQERGEFVYAAGLWLAGGGGLATATVTVPHEAGEALEAVWDRLEDHAGGLLRAGGARTVLARHGVEGVLRATEITRGRNGWHPHQHLVLWTAEPVGDVFEAGLREWWRKRREHWERKHRTKPELPPEREPLEDVKRVEPENVEHVGGHVTKGPSSSTYERWAKAKAEGKDDLAEYLQQFLAPFELGEQAADGDPEAMDAWAEYEETVPGRHWLRWPRGFRDQFGFGPARSEPAFEGELVATVPARSCARDLSKGTALHEGLGGGA